MRVCSYQARVIKSSAVQGSLTALVSSPTALLTRIETAFSTFTTQYGLHRHITPPSILSRQNYLPISAMQVSQ